MLVLPCPLIEEIVDALTYVFRTPELSTVISQHAVECCIQEAVHALLDDRLDASKGAKADRTGIIVKAINKVSFYVIDLVIIIDTVISIFYCKS